MPIGAGKNVGRLEAQLGLNSSEFQAGLRNAQLAMRQTGASLRSLTRDMGLAFGTTALVAGVGLLAKKIYDLGTAQEQTNIAFKVFLGDADKAKKLIGELTHFAKVTPFTSTEVFAGSRALLAFGFAGKEILPTIKMLGDISAGTGKDLRELAVIYGQIRTAGRLMGQDLLQLINAGFNPLQAISKKTGKNMLELRKDMEKGLISFDMVNEAFQDATSAGGLFFNMMEQQSQTVGGRMSTLLDNLEIIGKALFESNRGPLKDLINNLISITENTAQIISVFNGWLSVITYIPRRVFAVIQSIGELWTAWKQGDIAGIGKAWVHAITGIKTAQEELNKSTTALGSSFSTYIEQLKKDLGLGKTMDELGASSLTIKRLSTIADFEQKITELKQAARTAGAAQLPILGAQLKFYQQQHDELEALLKIQTTIPGTIAFFDEKIAQLKERSLSASKQELYILGAQLQKLEEQKKMLERMLTFKFDSVVNLSGDKVMKDLTGQHFADVMKRMDATIKPATQSISQSFIDMSKVIEQSLEGIVGSMAMALGDIASGLGGVELIGMALLGGIANMAEELGKMAIGVGITIGAIKKSLQSLNPVVAVAAGVALIALSRFVRNKAASIGGGGSSSGQKRGSIQGLASGGFVTQGGVFQLHRDELVTLPSGSAVTPANMARGGGNMNVRVQGRLSGYDLELSRERFNYYRGRTG